MYIEKIFGKQNITYEDIKNLLANHNEHRDFEFKGSIDDKINNFIKPIIGMANANGGLLITGVNNDKEIIGIKNEPGYIDKLNNWIKDIIEPSLLNHYNIMQIKLDKEKSLYLVGVESTANLYAQKKGGDFIYFIRNGSSTTQIRPNDIVTVATQKENYKYNEDYRKGLLTSINNAIQEIARFFDIKETYFIKLIEDKNIDELISAIKNAKTKNLSINIYQEVLQLNSNILYLNENKPHRNLTIKEDNQQNLLLNKIAYAYGYGFNEKLNENKIKEITKLPYHWLNVGNKNINNLNCCDVYSSLSLLGFIKDIYGYYEFLHNALLKYLANYDNNLNYILENLDLICKSKKPPINKEIKDSLQDELEKFPNIMAKELITVIGVVLLLKKATRQALYLE